MAGSNREIMKATRAGLEGAEGVYDSIQYGWLQKEIEGLVRRIGQERYFNEALPRLLEQFRRENGITTSESRYQDANQVLYLSGWFFSDCRGDKALRSMGEFLR